jgi:hypothetical protein
MIAMLWLSKFKGLIVKEKNQLSHEIHNIVLFSGIMLQQAGKAETLTHL